MSDKPRWEKWKGEKKIDFLHRLCAYEMEQKGIKSIKCEDEPGSIKLVSQDEVQEMIETTHRVAVEGRMCSRCEWWVPQDNGTTWGQCYRHPVSVTVRSTHWCAEFKNNNQHILGDE